MFNKMQYFIKNIELVYVGNILHVVQKGNKTPNWCDLGITKPNTNNITPNMHYGSCKLIQVI
jgi:hypothetical protein